MNCSTCGILYDDTIAHPPSACAQYAGAELAKAKKALDGALEQIAIMIREREGIFTAKELNWVIDSLGRNFSRLSALKDQRMSATDKEKLTREMEEVRVLHLRLVKWKRTV